MQYKSRGSYAATIFLSIILYARPRKEFWVKCISRSLSPAATTRTTSLLLTRNQMEWSRHSIEQWNEKTDKNSVWKGTRLTLWPYARLSRQVWEGGDRLRRKTSRIASEYSWYGETHNKYCKGSLATMVVLSIGYSTKEARYEELSPKLSQSWERKLLMTWSTEFNAF